MGGYNLPVNYEQLDPSERKSVREQYIKKQNGKCYWCKCPLDADPPASVRTKRISWDRFPPNFLRYPVHLQHDHSTGMTEGAVHSYCNAVMWQYHGR